MNEQAITAADVERVLASTILDRDARDAVRTAATAVAATGRHDGDAAMLRAHSGGANPSALLTALYRAGGRLAAALECAGNCDDVGDAVELARAERAVRLAHERVAECVVARALRRPA